MVGEKKKKGREGIDDDGAAASRESRRSDGGTRSLAISTKPSVAKIAERELQEPMMGSLILTKGVIERWEEQQHSIVRQQRKLKREDEQQKRENTVDIEGIAGRG